MVRDFLVQFIVSNSGVTCACHKILLHFYIFFYETKIKHEKLYAITDVIQSCLTEVH